MIDIFIGFLALKLLAIVLLSLRRQPVSVEVTVVVRRAPQPSKLPRATLLSLLLSGCLAAPDIDEHLANVLPPGIGVEVTCTVRASCDVDDVIVEWCGGGGELHSIEAVDACREFTGCNCAASCVTARPCVDVGAKPSMGGG